MGSEPVEELPDDLEAWVAERASADGTSRADVVRRLMAAHRLLDEHGDQLDGGDVSGFGDGTAGSSGVADSGLDDLDARVEELAGRVGELEADLDEKITDVRQRVVQVKREADAKAPADHDHPAVERRIDEGFENYEEILEYLTERTEALEDGADDRSAKLTRVANAVVGLRRRVAALEGEIEKRAAAADLHEAANRRGISEAACDSCGESVQLGLLDEPTCPHCESPFDGVESGGWFRSNRLTVGDRPALESGPAEPDAGGASGHAGSTSRSDGAETPESDPSAATGDDGSAGTGRGDASGLSDIADGPDGSGDDPAWVPDFGAGGPGDGAAGGDGSETSGGASTAENQSDDEGTGDR